MKAQEVFDTVVSHLRKQGRKAQTNGIADDSSDMGRCRYRLTQADGTVLMCAAGCLIHENEYSPEMDEEGNSDTSFEYVIRHHATESLYNRLLPHEELISTLQGIHDDCSVIDWEVSFKELAEQFQLQYTAP